MCRNRKIALLVPCYNEEIAIPLVIQDFQRALPALEIYVFNNNSTDKTKELALAHGA
ncbi:glycosyltransferase [Neisseriaceae bacterium TC5R-5]|nr:glycosyltransferase [Neisseriaceae bacterium TC5R-5]